MDIDYDKIFNKISSLVSEGFSRKVYWPKWENFLRQENQNSQILTDSAFLIRLVNERDDGFHFLKATFSNEFGEYIFDEEILDAALRKNKENWQHFSDDKKEEFELEYQLYYGNSKTRHELRKKIQELKETKKKSDDDDEDISDKQFETYENERMNGSSEEEALKKAQDTGNSEQKEENMSPNVITASPTNTQKKDLESSESKVKSSITEPSENQSQSTTKDMPPTNPNESEKTNINDLPENQQPTVSKSDPQTVAQPTTSSKQIQDPPTDNITPRGFISERMRNRPPRRLRQAQDDSGRQMLDHLRQQVRSLEDTVFRMKEEKINREGKIEKLTTQLTDARQHRSELEEIKIKQEIELQRVNNELVTTKSELEDLKRSNHFKSQDSLSGTLENAITQASRIVLYCTALAIASIFLVIFAFLR